MPSKPVRFSSAGLQLAGDLWFPDVNAPAPGVVLCHGFPPDQPLGEGDPGYGPLALALARAGIAVLTYTARGVGESEGDYSLLGWVEDCVAAFQFLGDQPDVNGASLAIAGFSAGGGIALEAAIRCNSVRGVAIVGAPARYRTLERTGGDPAPAIDRFRSMGMIRTPGFPESNDEWARGYREVAAEEAITRLSPRPVLIVQGGQDKTVSTADAEALYAAAGSPRELYMIGDGEHILRNDIRLRDVLRDWLLRTIGGASW